MFNDQGDDPNCCGDSQILADITLYVGCAKCSQIDWLIVERIVKE